MPDGSPIAARNSCDVAVPFEPRELLDAPLGFDGELQRTVGRLQAEQRAQRAHPVP